MSDEMQDTSTEESDRAGDAKERAKKKHAKDDDADEAPPIATSLKRIAQVIGGVTAILVALGAALGALKKDFDVLGLFSHTEAPGQGQTKLDAAPTTSETAHPLGAETITVAFFGTMTVGGKCDQTKPALGPTWNCVADDSKRAHCQNGIVVVELCPKGCKIEGSGKNDLCRP